jgi:hypothetical protein
VHLMSTRRALQHVVLKHLSTERIDKLSGQFIRQVGALRPLSAATSGAAGAVAASTPLAIHLSPPSVLQRSEPLVLRLRPRRASSSKHASDDPASWTHSSVTTSCPFESMWNAVSAHKEINLVQSPPDQHPGSDVHAAWLAQFEQLPFVAALQLQGVSEVDVVDPSSSMVGRTLRRAKSLWTLLVRSRTSGPAYSSVVQSDIEASAGAAAPGIPHLRIRLLFKTGCSSEQILLASLYTAYLRQGWASSPATAAVASHTQRAQQLHREALQLMRIDAEGEAPLQQFPAATVSAAPSQPADVIGAVNASAQSPAAPQPLPHSSQFVQALRNAGYQTASHFVEDDNPVRVHIATFASASDSTRSS